MGGVSSRCSLFVEVVDEERNISNAKEKLSSMRMFKISLALLLVVLLAISSQLALAAPNDKGGPLKGKKEMAQPDAARLNQMRPKAPWIESWYIPDGGYMNNGGFAPSAPIDHIDEATKGKLTQPLSRPLKACSQPKISRSSLIKST